MAQRTNPTTVDAIIERESRILLIQRGNDPFGGYFALPGGFVDYGETVESAVKREAQEELSLTVTPTAILGVYSGPDRDPRGPVISTVFICTAVGHVQAGDDAASFDWVHVDNIHELDLAFDHSQILSDYQQWKVNNGSYWTNKRNRAVS